MAARRRPRIRAADLAPRRRSPFIPLLILIGGLALILAYKASSSDKVASFVETLAADPGLELPPSVLERDGGLDPFDAGVDAGLDRVPAAP